MFWTMLACLPWPQLTRGVPAWVKTIINTLDSCLWDSLRWRGIWNGKFLDQSDAHICRYLGNMEGIRQLTVDYHDHDPKLHELELSWRESCEVENRHRINPQSEEKGTQENNQSQRESYVVLMVYPSAE